MVRDKHVIFFVSLCDQRDFMAKFGGIFPIFNYFSSFPPVIYALPRYLSRSLTIVLPFFPTGTMERVCIEGEIGILHFVLPFSFCFLIPSFLFQRPR
jgi:hypothetical protein